MAEPSEQLSVIHDCSVVFLPLAGQSRPCRNPVCTSRSGLPERRETRLDHVSTQDLLELSSRVDIDLNVMPPNHFDTCCTSWSTLKN